MGASEIPKLSPLPFHQVRTLQDGKVIFQLQVPISCIGLAIGRGGCHVKEVGHKTSTKIYFETRLLKETDRLCTCTLIGTDTGVKQARTLIQDVIFKHIRHQMVKNMNQEKIQLKHSSKDEAKNNDSELVSKKRKNRQDKPVAKKHMNSIRINPREFQNNRKSHAVGEFARRYCSKGNCRYRCFLQNKLDSHLKKVHIDPMKDRAKNKYMNAERTDHLENSQSEFSCNNCWRSFRDRKSLMKHLVVSRQDCDVRFTLSQRKQCFCDMQNKLNATAVTYILRQRRDVIVPFLQNKLRMKMIGFSSNTMSVTQEGFVLLIGPPFAMTSTPDVYRTTDSMKQSCEFPGTRLCEPEEKKQELSLMKKAKKKKQMVKSQVQITSESEQNFLQETDRMKTSMNKKEKAKSQVAIAPQNEQNILKTLQKKKRPQPAPEKSRLNEPLTSTSKVLNECTNTNSAKVESKPNKKKPTCIKEKISEDS